MKLKLGIKSIIKYIYILIALINIFLLYLIYDFTKLYILGAISPGETLIRFQDRKYSEDLNIKKFDDAIKKIKIKKNNNVVPSTNDTKDMNISTSSVNNL